MTRLITLRSGAVSLMFLSGASALVFETVWMRMLIRTFGVTAHAVAVLVALYMGGLALGSAWAAGFRKSRDWLKTYALLEAGACALSLLSSQLMPRIAAIAAAWGTEEPLGPWPRLLLAAPVLLPPTFLLGATLPTLIRSLDVPAGRRETQSGLAALYAANTLGACGGVVFAAFWGLGQWGERNCLWIAAGLNLAAAAGAWRLSKRGRDLEPHALRATQSSSFKLFRPGLADGLVLVAGFCSLGYEVLWSRQLIPLLGNSTYAFASVLAVYLAGIGLGSFLAPRLLSPSAPASDSFGWLELAVSAAALLGLFCQRLLGLGMDSPDFLYSPIRSAVDFPVLLTSAAIVALPASLAMGLAFPAAARMLEREDISAGAAAGRLLAWSTLGGIAGALWTGFFAVTALGTHASLLALAFLNAGAGVAALSAAGATAKRLALAGALLALLAFAVRRDPALEILSRRLSLRSQDSFKILFHKESAEASVTGVAHGGARTLFINGIETSGKGLEGAMMAVLPNLLLEKPRSMLVICLGVGNTLRAAALLAGQAYGVELIDEVARRLPVFQPELGPPPSPAPNARVFIDDGRHYLLRSRRRYDSIIVDAAPPLYSAGAVNLYTKEFMELAASRLTPEGIFALWLPLRSFEEDYWRILRGLTDVFPYAAVWSEPYFSGFLCLGSARPLDWSKQALQRRIRERDLRRVAPALRAEHLRAWFVLSGDDIRSFTRNMPPVTDDLPSTEFPLWRFLAGRPLMRSPDFLLKARTGPSRPEEGWIVPSRRP